MTGKSVRIGCGAGFWGDSPDGAAQIVRSGKIDYLVMDYLAEITMSILARMKAKSPDLGYALDFVSGVMKPLAREIAEKKIRVVTNAGGVNPEACRDQLLALFKKIGVDLKVAIVLGDDLSAQAERYRSQGAREMFSGAPMPANLASINAYLGAFPIAAALDAGADIVITGRAVDSAIVLGPLIHEFGWKPTDYAQLSAGSLAGHLLECGPQVTGGIFTDWETVCGWDNMGYPIAECHADGGFIVTKPEGTGGFVTEATVAEQAVYEVGDPTSYILPDVIADWSAIHLQQQGPDRVKVGGARGLPPTDSYKVSATYADGYRAFVTMAIIGRNAVAKAQATGEAILKRANRMIMQAGFSEIGEASLETLGGEANYGANARRADTREVILKIAVRHEDKQALKIFAGEIFQAATSMAQGLTGFAGGRPEPQPVIRLFSFTAAKRDIPVTVKFNGQTIEVPHGPVGDQTRQRIEAGPVAVTAGPLATVPLIALAHGRSGDKGDIGNIGILARKSGYLPWIRRSATPEAVHRYFAHFVKDKVECFEWPGLNGLNFLLHEGLGGGGIASLRHDPQGKALAEIMMDFPVEVPAEWVASGGQLQDWREEAMA